MKINGVEISIIRLIFSKYVIDLSPANCNNSIHVISNNVVF